MVDVGGPVILNISDMIDMAIGTPEVGVVDFNMLQTVLHCLAQQLRILGKNVELRGSFAALSTGRDNVQTINVSEFVVDTGDTASTKGYKEIKSKDASAAPSGLEDSILVVERVKKSDAPQPPRTLSPGPLTPGAMPASTAQSAPGVSTEKLSLVTLSKFNLLENTVADLKSRVYGSMPKNEEILEGVRSQTNVQAITDMWTSLNVSSRLEAAENGIAKLSSLVQDLIGETVDLQRKTSQTEGVAPATTVKSTAAMAPTIAPSSTGAPTAPLVLHSGEDGGPSPEDLAALQAFINHMRGDLDQLTGQFYKALDEMIGAAADATPDADGVGGVEGALGADSADAAGKVTPVAFAPSGGGATRSVTHGGMAGDRLNDLERRLKECCDTMTRNDDMLHGQVTSIQDQVSYLMKQVAGVSKDAAAANLSPDLVKDLQGLMQLFTTVQEMQAQLEQVHETAKQLATEKDDRQHHINALLEQIELLKAIKMDREDMAEAMAEKADLRALARKVSHDQFETACDDLSRGLEHAIGKLNMQEALWQQALDDIQREIETKLDKMELSPVKDFFNNKLKQLQENLKQMASLRREVEAAGTKRRLLRDVNCISCDANAVMAMDTAPVLPSSKPMPPSLSMKPYLSYELDAIRKTQASNVPQRNMHDWETIDKQMAQHKHVHKARSETDKHLCNRYCGGSHTVTTPAQRVARLGHFVKQWGPDVLPLSSGLAAGDDGRMYKVTTAESANVGPGGAVDATCTPRTPQRKSDTPRSPHKTLVISNECRCLEGEHPMG